MLYEGKNPILRITDVAQRRRSFASFSIGPQEHSEISLLISGSITVNCSEREYNLHAGDIIYLPQNMVYTASYTEAEIITIRFEVLLSDPEPELYSLYGTNTFQKMFSVILDLWTSKEYGYEINCISMFYRFLCTVMNRSQVPPHIKKAVAYIHANYRNSDLTIGQIADYIGVSQTVLRKLFNIHYKKSPIEYIIHLRLLNAQMLISNGVPVETAALESGFNDPKYFARVTRKYLNRTPSELKDFE